MKLLRLRVQSFAAIGSVDVEFGLGAQCAVRAERSGKIDDG